MSLLLAGSDQPRVFGNPRSPETGGCQCQLIINPARPIIGKLSFRDPKVLD